MNIISKKKKNYEYFVFNNIFDKMVVAMFSMFVSYDVFLKILCPSVGSIGFEFFIHLNHNDNKYCILQGGPIQIFHHHLLSDLLNSNAFLTYATKGEEFFLIETQSEEQVCV